MTLKKSRSSSKKLQKLLSHDGSFKAQVARKKSISELVPAANINERVILNVGGQRHETFLATLNRLPDTRLSKLAQDYEDDPAYDKVAGEFFFNRNPIVFLSILQYYRTGELHIDYNICGNAIKNEFDFWQIDPNDIEPCCWAQYAKFLQNKETLKMLDDSFAIYEDVFAEPEGESDWKRLQRRLWRLVEDPSYSAVGKIVAWLSLFFVLVSIVAYVLETHDDFRVMRPEFVLNHSNSSVDLSNVDDFRNCTCLGKGKASESLHQVRMDELNSDVVWWLSWVTLVCFCWFSIEYLFRLICCPNKRIFFKSTLNNMDLVVLCLMLIECLAIIFVNQLPRNNFLKFLIPLRFARIIRIMKLMKHYRAFKVLVYTIKVSIKELLLMIIFLMIGVVIFACFVYYVEPDNFTSIPIGCWWALVTMTTVGYGDFHPNEIGGYIIGSIAAIFGVLMIAFTVPIVVNNFSLYYSHAQTRAKMRPKRRATKLLNKLAALTTFVPTLAEIQEEAEQLAAAEAAEEKMATAASATPVGITKRPSVSSSADSALEEKKLIELARERGRRPSRVSIHTRPPPVANLAILDRLQATEEDADPSSTAQEDEGSGGKGSDVAAMFRRKRSFSIDRFMAAKDSMPVASERRASKQVITP